MRMLAQAGVLVGFCGGGGTPLFMGTEQEIAVEWFTPQSEYRPTEYVQGWLSWWWEADKRLHAAKVIQQARVDFLTHVWSKDKEFKTWGFNSQMPEMVNFLQNYREQISKQTEIMHLLQLEARMTKELYKLASNNTKQTGFTREHASQTAGGIDKANSFLNHDNYLAYGLGATTAWVLGIPHGFAVMHGKTRRGALVFDIADIVKDAIVLPLAFICASENVSEQEFRQECLNYFTQYNALDTMFEVVKNLALKKDWAEIDNADKGEN